MVHIRKIGLALLVIAALVSPIFNRQVVYAIEPPIGKEVRVADNATAHYTGNKRINPQTGKWEYEFVQTITPVPTAVNGRDIDTSWYLDENGVYSSGNNLFSAKVVGETVTVTHKGESYTYTPSLSLGTSKDIAPTPMSLITQDKKNKDWHYAMNTLTWQYPNFTRNLRIMEGSISETYIFDKDPGKDVTIDVIKQKTAGFIWEQTPTAVDKDNKAVKLTVDANKITLSKDDLAKASYPLEIDPTSTFTPSVDGSVRFLLFGASWATMHDWGAGSDVDSNSNSMFIWLESYSSANTYSKLYRDNLSFDTSSIPVAANITYANLALYGWYSSNSWIGFTPGINIYSWTPNTPGSLVLADYALDGTTAYSTQILFSSFNTAGYNNFILNATGISGITKGGLSSFSVRESVKDAPNVEPAWESLKAVVFGIVTSEGGSSQWPILTVTYYASAIPTVTTNDATFVGQTNATLNGYLNSGNGEDTPWSFYYGTTSGLYNKWTGWQSPNVTDGNTFNYQQTGLSVSQQYYYIASAYNSVGSSNGTEKSFTTSSTLQPPTNFSATDRNDTIIDLTFTTALGVTNTYIRHKIGSYPADQTDGILSFNGTGGSASVSGLEPGTPYFFKAWGYDISSGNFSASYDTDIATTTGNITIRSIVDTRSGSSANWFLNPSTDTVDGAEALSYPSSVVNATYDSMSLLGWDIPKWGYWAYMYLAGAAMMGTFFLVRTKSLLWTIGGVTIGFMAGVFAGIFPVWVVFIYICGASALVWISLRMG